MSDLKKMNAISIIALSAVVVLTMTCLFVLNYDVSSTMFLVKEFNVSEATAAAVLSFLGKADTAVTIAGILAILGTGGAGVVAAAGKQGVKAFLKKQLKKKGKKAFVAW